MLLSMIWLSLGLTDLGMTAVYFTVSLIVFFFLNSATLNKKLTKLSYVNQSNQKVSLSEERKPLYMEKRFRLRRNCQVPIVECVNALELSACITIVRFECVQIGKHSEVRGRRLVQLFTYLHNCQSLHFANALYDVNVKVYSHTAKFQHVLQMQKYFWVRQYALLVRKREKVTLKRQLCH